MILKKCGSSLSSKSSSFGGEYSDMQSVSHNPVKYTLPFISYEYLKKEVFKNYSIGYIHGKMKKDERDKQMTAMANNEIQCLVSTTVVEVGIDIPNSTIMVIENAERFGLTQLHQLRGRIGRGKIQSYCILIQHGNSPDSMHRLKIMESTSNGFTISDEDLKLRGPGEFFGTRQHGYVKTKIAIFQKMAQ